MTPKEYQLELTEEEKESIREFAKRLLDGDPEAVAYANSVGITIVTD
jgi:hypothetical protein